MFRSPPNLRSGSKGQPVPLSTADKTDKTQVERSLSTSDISNSSKPTTMGGVDKSEVSIDPVIVERCVNKYLSGEDAFTKLAAKLAEEMKSVVEVAVKFAVASINQELSALRGEVSHLVNRVKEVEGRLADKTDELEQYQRRNNIRIFGIKEQTGEKTDELVVTMCREKLGVEVSVDALCRTHRVGKQPRPAVDGRELHRPIIVRFVSYRHRQQVFGAKKKLKGTGVTIREDLTPRRLEVLRAASAQHGPRNTWTQDGRVLWVDGGGRRGVATRMADLTTPGDS